MNFVSIHKKFLSFFTDHNKIEIYVDGSLLVCRFHKNRNGKMVILEQSIYPSSF